MNEEERFDELLNSKLSERDFPFDELNWDEAERLLTQQERMRKVTRFALIFSAGLAAGVFIMLPFMITTHNALTNAIATKSTAVRNPLAQNSISPLANQSPNTNNTISKEEKAPLPVQSAFAKKDNSTGFRSTSSNISPVAKKSKESPLFVADINKLPAESNPVASTGNNTGHTETINQQEQTTSSNTTTADNNNSNNTTSPITFPAVTIIASKILTGNTANSPPPPSMLRTTPTSYVHSDAHSSNILSVYAGGNYSFGWNDNGVKEGSGITPWAGLNFTHCFTDDISASLGVGYSELANLNQTYASGLIQYDFGVNTSGTNVTPQMVYYIAFPLKLQYNVDNKDMFGIGVDYLLMLTTSSTLTTYQQNSLSETPGTSIKQNGYTQGFSNSDMQLTLSYTRMLTGRLGVGAEYYYDFDNVENNTIPGINQSAKNMGIRLILSYQLMK